MFFKKKKKIRFTNAIDGIVENYPLIRASKLNRSWLKKPTEQFKKDYKDLKSGCPFTGFRPNNIAKCPGIKSLFDTGYILTCPYDFRVVTNGDGNTVDLNLPFQHSELGFAPLATHKEEVLHRHCPAPHNTLKSILKVDGGWQVTAPDDVVFWMTNLHYTEEQRFSSVTGILDPKHSTKVISQLYWHVLDGTEIIKAGTPLTHLIPMKRGFNPEFECDLPNENDIHKQRISYFNTINTFTS